MAVDPDPRVRFQCALSLGEYSDDAIVPALVKIAAYNLDDKWTRAAVLSGIAHREEQFLHAFLPVAITAKSESLPAMMEELGRMLAATAPAEKLAPLLSEILESNHSDCLPWQMAAAGGFGEGLRSRGFASRDQSPIMRIAGSAGIPA